MLKIETSSVIVLQANIESLHPRLLNIYAAETILTRWKALFTNRAKLGKSAHP